MSRIGKHRRFATAIGLFASTAWAQTATLPPAPPASAPVPAPAIEPKTVPSAPATTKEAQSGGLSVETSENVTAAPAAASAASTANATPSATETAPAPLEATAATPGDEANKPWLDQMLLTDGLVEIGAAVGLLFPSRVLNLQSQTAKHQHLSTAPELGVRVAYFPLKYVGGELEYMAGFSKTDKDDQSANTWAFRGQIIGQYPGKRIVPFALLGAGRMGVISNSMGSDGDPLFHFGVGVKAPLTESLLARFDIRDNMAQKHGASDGTLCNSWEVLLGVSMTLGRPQPPPPKVVEDTDGDGLVDRVDKCPLEAGVGADGCPLKDSDGDGVMDNEDKCLDIKGVPPDGCPSTRDSDGDGLIDSKDKCPNAAETKNGFEDADGCPDEIPAQVKEFTGVIQGIEFDRDKATIRPTSSAALDKSAAVLTEYPSLRVLITGHTDNTGTRDKNVQLSKERAESVKAYLVGKGVEPSRIEAKGAGPDEPIDSNVTAAGRQRNRRIEFKLLKDSD